MDTYPYQGNPYLILDLCIARNNTSLEQCKTQRIPYHNDPDYTTRYKVWYAKDLCADVLDFTEAGISYNPIYQDTGTGAFAIEPFTEKKTRRGKQGWDVAYEMRDWEQSSWNNSYGIQIFTGEHSGWWTELDFEHEIIAEHPDAFVDCFQSLITLVRTPLITITKSGGLRFSCRTPNYAHGRTDAEKRYIYRHDSETGDTILYLEIFGKKGQSRWDARYEIISGDIFKPPIIDKEALFELIDKLKEQIHTPAPDGKPVQSPKYKPDHEIKYTVDDIPIVQYTDDDVYIDTSQGGFNHVFPEAAWIGLYEIYRSAFDGRIPIPESYTYANLRYAIGSVVGRKYYIDSEPRVYPNFYGALVGDSSLANKGISLRQSTELIQRSDTGILITTDVSTSEGILDCFVEPTLIERKNSHTEEVETHWVGGYAQYFDDVMIDEIKQTKCINESIRICAVVDELRSFLAKSSKSSGAGSLEMVMELYDMRSRMTSTLKSGGTTAKYPTFNLIGATDKKLIEVALKSEYIHGGFTNRFEWFYGEPQRQLLINRKRDSHLFDKCVKVISTLRRKFDDSENQIPFTLSDEAIEVGQGFLDELQDKILKQDDFTESMVTNSLKRAKIHMLKNALTYAIIQNEPNDTIISGEHVHAAVAVSLYTQASVEYVFENFSMSDDMKLQTRIEKYLTKHGKMTLAMIRNQLKCDNVALQRNVDAMQKNGILGMTEGGKSPKYFVVKIS
ncbi:MAG: DUF3987 domain-containing protein [Candidatus Poribacteria bacterium]|nr:DUF3987 domain-containing protein [Candidatus Poribacteria bacterium]